MEKLSNVTGITSSSKCFDILHAKNELEKKKKLYNSVKLSVLPDKGAKLKEQIVELENALKTLSLKDVVTCDVNNSKDTNSASLKNNVGNRSKTEQDLVHEKKSTGVHDECHPEERRSISDKQEKASFSKMLNACGENKYLSFSDLIDKKSVNSCSENVMDSPSFKSYRDSGNVRKILLTEPKTLIEAPLSKGSSHCHFSYNPYLQTDEECIKKIHKSLKTYPDDSKEESEPENLKSSLMMHQKSGLAWLIWREHQDPSGGILADDMGLGKTLTMISLILKQKEKLNYSSFQEEEFECRGTLIICLASIIHQWNDEINKHCERDALKVYLYHGPKRDKSFKKLMTYDVVLTTYNIVLSEKKAVDAAKESPLFKLKWERIVLDEAHTIKNHASLTAQAIFNLRSFKKWAVTGTPIHNVFKDVYSLVKFLDFSPFDDYKKFKTLTDDNSESSEQRKSLLIKSILLRRTKEQVDEWGKPLIEMRNKSISVCYIELSPEEREIYDKLNNKITHKFNQYFEKSSKFKSSSLLVLLLRLQQCCNHLSLLEHEAEEPDDSTDIINNFSSLTINETDDSDSKSSNNLDLTFNELEACKLSDKAIKSSKIKELFNELYRISECSAKKDKSVIVSQWVCMLNVVAYHLKQENIAYHIIVGNTKVEDRQKFADDFNYNEDGAKLMLLSLKAGGVGLNLVGANHLFLLDLHWNPALEMQACDRIHRVGQKKDVTIYKFICKNTIEEKILSLQESKRRIASSALRGVKQNTKGLTIEDFKELFRVRK